MVDWHSPAELARDQVATSNLVHVLAGIYFWEFLNSLDFEWSFIRGRKRFNWPMVPYFLGRYSALGALIASLISDDSPTELDCQVLMTFLTVCGSFMIGFSSTNLAIRTMVVWGMRWHCVIPLCFLMAGHWALLIQNTFLTGATWLPGMGCFTLHTTAVGLSVTFIYSICFDFIVLCLLNLVFQDGLIYFIVAFLVNVPPAIVASLQLNPLMDVMFTLPASVITVITASRAVRRLSNFSYESPAIYVTVTYPESSGVDAASNAVNTGRPSTTIPRRSISSSTPQMRAYAPSETRIASSNNSSSPLKHEGYSVV